MKLYSHIIQYSYKTQYSNTTQYSYNINITINLLAIHIILQAIKYRKYMPHMVVQNESLLDRVKVLVSKS